MTLSIFAKSPSLILRICEMILLFILLLIVSIPMLPAVLVFEVSANRKAVPVMR